MVGAIKSDVTTRRVEAVGGGVSREGEISGRRQVGGDSGPCNGGRRRRQL